MKFSREMYFYCSPKIDCWVWEYFWSMFLTAGFENTSSITFWLIGEGYFFSGYFYSGFF